MGRSGGARLRDRDEQVDTTGRGPRRPDRPGTGAVSDHLLSLQRDYGNTAVTTIVQRKGHPKAASTDAPGAKKSAPAPKQEDYAPTEHSAKYGSWSDDELNGHINDYTKSNVKNGLLAAAEMSEELWFRHQSQSRAYAMGVWRVYKQLGDDKRTAFWLGVMQGTITPGKHAAEDQAGKEF